MLHQQANDEAHAECRLTQLPRGLSCPVKVLNMIYGTKMYADIYGNRSQALRILDRHKSRGDHLIKSLRTGVARSDP